MPITPTARAEMYDVANGDPPPEAQRFKVQFNPITLSYAIQNTLRPPDRAAGTGTGGRAAQFVAQATAKLEFDLVFDTTHDGHDVRGDTSKIKAFLAAGGHANPNAAAPPVVVFSWGAFKFRGFIESMRESLDFFSQDGVPLRSSVKLSMAAQDTNAIFTGETFAGPKSGGMDAANVQLVSVPPAGTSALGTKGGNSGAGRGIAAANGLESIRNAGAGLVAVASGSVQLKGAAAFSAGASAGFGAGAGAGFGASAGASAGFGAGASAGFGASAGAGFGASAGAGAGFSAGAGASFGASASAGAGLGGGASFGASAGAGLTTGAGFTSGASASFGGASSAGVSAAAGAFAGLGVSKTASTVTLNTAAFQARATTNVVSTEFAVGGRAVAGASSGLTTNVGASARLRFD